MVKHIVLYKLFDGSPENRKAVTDRLMSMRGKIEVLKEIETGHDFLASERSYDICLICSFLKREDLKEYAEHPLHLPVKQFMKTVTEKSVSVDFEF